MFSFLRRNHCSVYEKRKQIFCFLKKGLVISLNTKQVRLLRFGNKRRRTSTFKNTHWKKVALGSEKYQPWLEQCNIYICVDLCIVQPLKTCLAKKRANIFLKNVKRPQKMHACGYFSAHGFGVLRCSTESLNALRMIKLYKKSLMWTTFGGNCSNCFLDTILAWCELHHVHSLIFKITLLKQ